MRGTPARRVDHVVLAVPSLDEARAVFEALGFLVAPDARHPFGTENACIFFADGTYVEPLAVGEREACEAAAKGGNVFVAHDQAYRFRRSASGFSGVALASGDAEADRAGFRRAGIDGGDLLAFGRTARLPDGSEAELGFRLAFATDRRAPDLLGFTCQPIHRTPLDRSALSRHENGTTGMRRLILSEPNPTDFQYFLQDLVVERTVTADSFGFSIQAANLVLDVETPESLALRYGAMRGEDRGLRIEGLVLEATDLGGIAARCRAASLPFRTIGERLVVPLGTGAFLAFEAASPGA